MMSNLLVYSVCRMFFLYSWLSRYCLDRFIMLKERFFDMKLAVSVCDFSEKFEGAHFVKNDNA